ncbi:MAG: hypothetical protein R3D25_15375 [Geminicoccaceae bacterium]
MPPQPLGPGTGVLVPANTTQLSLYPAPPPSAGILPRDADVRVTKGTGNQGAPEHKSTVTVPGSATQAQPVVLAVQGPANVGRILRIKNTDAQQTLMVDAT